MLSSSQAGRWRKQSLQPFGEPRRGHYRKPPPRGGPWSGGPKRAKYRFENVTPYWVAEAASARISAAARSFGSVGLRSREARRPRNWAWAGQLPKWRPRARPPTGRPGSCSFQEEGGGVWWRGPRRGARRSQCRVGGRAEVARSRARPRPRPAWRQPMRRPRRAGRLGPGSNRRRIGPMRCGLMPAWWPSAPGAIRSSARPTAPWYRRRRAACGRAQRGRRPRAAMVADGWRRAVGRIGGARARRVSGACMGSAPRGRMGGACAARTHTGGARALDVFGPQCMGGGRAAGVVRGRRGGNAQWPPRCGRNRGAQDWMSRHERWAAHMALARSGPWCAATRISHWPKRHAAGGASALAGCTNAWLPEIGALFCSGPTASRT